MPNVIRTNRKTGLIEKPFTSLCHHCYNPTLLSKIQSCSVNKQVSYWQVINDHGGLFVYCLMRQYT